MVDRCNKDMSAYTDLPSFNVNIVVGWKTLAFVMIVIRNWQYSLSASRVRTIKDYRLKLFEVKLLESCIN